MQNETSRLAALLAYSVLDTDREENFDSITRLAAGICNAPIAIITLLDEKRQWFKSCVGLSMCETDREISFCTHAIQQDGLYVVTNASEHETFNNNPLVTGFPHIRFYAGYPLKDPNGYNLGTLCVIDTVSRKLTEFQEQSLQALAMQAVTLIVNNRSKKELASINNLFQITSDFFLIVQEDYTVSSLNPALACLIGINALELQKQPFSPLLHPNDRQAMLLALNSVRHGLNKVEFANRVKRYNGEYSIISWSATYDKALKLFYITGRDITAKNEAEQNLLRTKNLLLTASKIGRVGGWEFDFNTRRYTLSPVCCEILGIEEHLQPDACDVFQFFQKEDADKVLHWVNEVCKNPGPFDGQFLITDANGDSRWIRLVANTEGELSHTQKLYGVVQDIHNEKLAEIRLDQKRLAFQQTFRHAPHGMFTIDPKSLCIKDLNEAFCAISGLNEHEIPAIPFLKLMHREDEAAISELLNNLHYTHADSGSIQCRLTVTGKEQVWVDLSLTLVLNVNSKPVSIIAQVVDITNRIEAEKLLQISEEKHRSYFENSEGLVCTFDREGTILSINPKGAEVLGYNSKELEQRSLYEIVDPAYHFRFRVALKKIRQSDQRNGWIKLRHKNGNGSTWLFNMHYCQLANGENYIICTALDISDRIALEKSLVEAKESAIKSMRSKDVFLANMSHEIRTPMNAIMGFATLLEQTNLSKEQREYNSYIKSSAENLLGIINDILDFSKIESGHLQIEKTVFEPEKVFAGAVQMLKPAASARGISLQYTKSSPMPDSVVGDPTRLSQIIINLLSNSIKFTEAGSVHLEVTIEDESIESARFKVLVSDTGIGIAADKLERIFDRFTQADADTTRKYGGTGLGLSIVKSLVKLQGGEVWVHSMLGQGSVFGFTIPYQKVKSQTKTVGQPEHLANITTQHASILLAEDNLLNTKLACKVLERFGYTVTTACNGLEAVSRLKESNFDLILMDLEMPELDGYQATELIRKVLKLDIPILAMTAHSLVGEQEKCLRIGMNGYISKPFNHLQLLDTIENAISDYKGKVTAAPKTDEKPDNLKHLQDFSAGNPAVAKELVGLFVQETPADLARMKMAINKMDLLEIKKVAHKMTTSFQLLGIDSRGILERMQYGNLTDTRPEALLTDYAGLAGIYHQVSEEIIV